MKNDWKPTHNKKKEIRAMANDNLKRILELSKKMDNGSYTESPNSRRFTGTSMTPEQQIQQFDNMVYGPSVAESTNEYSAEKELERIKARENQPIDVSHSKMPQAILESFAQNPNVIDPSIIEDPRMANLQERLKTKYGSSGVSAAKQIQDKLEEADNNKRLKEASIKSGSNNVVVDYSLIKSIVESVIDDRLNKRLDESVSHSNQSGLRSLIIKDGFYFLDDNDNVYECKMVYKGKRKKKK